MDVEAKGVEIKIIAFNDLENGWMNGVEDFVKPPSRKEKVGKLNFFGELLQFPALFSNLVME